MKEIAAYMLLVLGGNDSPSAADIAKVLEAGGQSADSAAAAAIVNACDGKSIDEVIEELPTE